MSAAHVAFVTLAAEEAEPGKEQAFYFVCPKWGHQCGRILIRGKTTIPHDPKNANGGQAQWTWDGNREAPTFTPSIDCKGCWHGYIRAGRCVDVNGNDEPEPKR